MFLPTFKKDQDDAYYRFTPADLEAARRHWGDEAQRRARRPPSTWPTRPPSTPALARSARLDLSARRTPTPRCCMGWATRLISDYSSALSTSLLTGRPAISFAYDWTATPVERGRFYDLDEVLPGPVCRTVDELTAGPGGRLFARDGRARRNAYDRRRALFFDFVDGSWQRPRVVNRVKGLYSETVEQGLPARLVGDEAACSGKVRLVGGAARARSLARSSRRHHVER